MTPTLTLEIEEEIVIVPRPPSGRSWALLFVICGLLLFSLAALQVISFVEYERSQRYLTALIDRIASPSLPPSQQAIAIVEYLRNKSDRSNRQSFLLPIFSVLRPTAKEVATGGGDCADQSRFTIVLLKLRNIQAQKWALYDPHLKPHHAVVELISERGKMVIDPLFGMWFPRPDGGYYDIESLRRNREILRQRVQELTANSTETEPATDGYHVRIREYPLKSYIYTNARTINWDKSLVMRLSYRLLHFSIGDLANHVPRPDFVEQPALMVIYGAIIPEVCILIVLIGAVRRWRRQSL